MAKDRVVLAYSGGLDTSICIKWLQEEKGLDVIAVAGDVGQQHQGLQIVHDKALDLGAIDSRVIDMREEFCEDFLSKALAANAMYENKYPLVSALSRPVIVKHLVDVAHETGARYIAHGCTGKGNDQVRFELGIQALDPELEIIAPAREWDLLTRPAEIAYAEKHGVPVPATKASPYSIDDNLWGRAIECGILEDPWAEPPEDVYTMTSGAHDAPAAPEYVEISFEHGIPCGLNGEPKSFMDIILAMNEIAGRNGFGRIDMIENRLVGVKSRECYEVPGALTLIQAHKALEDLVLERDLLHYKLGIEQTWATTVYNGLWFSPLKEALDGFCSATQQLVSGDVRLRFYKGSCVTVGRRSKYSLYDYSLATYDEGDTFDRDAAKGFIELHGLPNKTWARRRKETGTPGQI
ncbi:MAG: argininosuccinate synthase [Coriobacteriales bacterium]|nr:argininosuccinate synthase [Coriobacteriales bacterium]